MQPQSAKLRLRQLIFELDHHLGSDSSFFRPFMPAFQDNICGGNGKGRIRQRIGGEGVVGLPMVELFFLVEVLVRPALESEKRFLAGEIFTGNTDEFSVCGGIHNGIRVFLIKCVYAFTVNHFGSSDFLRFELRVKSNLRPEGHGTVVPV